VTPAAEARIRAAAAELAEALVAAVAAQECAPRPERLLSIAEAAELAGVGRTALYQAMARGDVRSVRIGRRRLIPASSIRALAEAT
jgi:excisionase family DNA binding protein